jgi:hypothetical protein
MVGDGRGEEEEEEGMISKAITEDESGNKSFEGGEGMCESAQGTHEVEAKRGAGITLEVEVSLDKDGSEESSKVI